jgi:hypothetical protein
MKKLKFYSIFLFVLLLSACSSSDFSSELKPNDVIEAFKEAGLEAESPKKMTKDDFGMAPMKSEDGLRFLIPSLGEDNGGRIISYKNSKDLDEMKKYYDDLGKNSAIFFSWTTKHENILVQINGDLEESEFKKYEKALKAIK